MDHEVAFSLLEEAAACDVGRGSSVLAAHAKGGLLAAAQSLVHVPGAHVAVVTGFFLPRAVPPTAETDGPIGAVMVARALGMLGSRATVVTDELCYPVVLSAAEAAGVGSVEAAPLGRDYSAWEVDFLRRHSQPPLTHVIAIERVGPSYSGPKYNMRGQDITAHSAPLERLMDLDGVYTIGIGDGGNELGMGTVDRSAIASVVPLGETIACAVACDSLIVGGTSNWGAYALTCGLKLLSGSDIDFILTPEWSQTLLESVAAAGAADGVLLKAQPTVDGLTATQYCDKLRQMASIVDEATPTCGAS